MLFLIAMEQDDLCKWDTELITVLCIYIEIFYDVNILHELKEVLWWCSYSGKLFGMSSKAEYIYVYLLTQQLHIYVIGNRNAYLCLP